MHGSKVPTLGVQLLQLGQEDQLVYTHWINATPTQKIILPRKAPKIYAYIGGGMSVLGLSSFLFKEQARVNASQASSVEEYRKEKDKESFWFWTSLGLSSLSISSFGIYFFW